VAGEVFVGRAATMAAFAEQVAKLDRPKLDRPQITVFVVTGESGIGKTRLAQQLVKHARDTQTIRIDWDYVAQPATALALTEQLARSIAEQAQTELKAYQNARQSLLTVRRRLEGLRRRHAQDWNSARQETEAENAAAKGVGALARGALGQAAPGLPEPYTEAAGDLVRAGTHAAMRAHRRFAARLWARGVLDERSHTALADPADHLARALVADLRRISAKRPLVIWLDTCERVRRLLPYLTVSVISRLTDAPILWVISGQRLQPDDPLDTVPGWARPVAGRVLVDVLREFTSDELTELVTAVRGPDHATLARRLANDTLGIPVLANWAVHDHDWLIGAVTPGQSIEDRKRGFFARLFGRLPEQDVLMLSVLAMTGGHTRSPLVTSICADLGIANPREEFARLERDPFLLPTGKLHELRRSYLRDRLLRDDSFGEYRERIAEHYVLRTRRRWVAVARRYPDFGHRFDAEPGVIAAAIEYCAASFWFRFSDGCRETIQLWTETLVAGDRGAAELLLVAEDFAADPAARRLERRLLRTAAALCATELAVPGCVTAWHEYPHGARLVTTARWLAQRLHYPERILFALDLGLAYLGATKSITPSDTEGLLRRHGELADDARAGFAATLSQVVEAAASRAAFGADGQPIPHRSAAAAAAYRDAVVLAPQQPLLRLNAAKVAFCAGMQHEAWTNAAKAIELATGDHRIVLQAADLLWKLGDGRSSMDAVRELALTRPQDPMVLSFGYWHKLRSGRFGEAAQWAARLLAAVAPDGVIPVEFGYLPGEIMLLHALCGGDVPSSLRSGPPPGMTYTGIGSTLAAALAGDPGAMIVLRDQSPASWRYPVDVARLRLYGLFAAHVAGEDEAAMQARFQSARESVTADPGYADLLVCVCDVPAVTRAVCVRLGHTDCTRFYTELDSTRQVLEHRRTASLDFSNFLQLDNT
jgi:hypothetical protein